MSMAAEATLAQGADASTGEPRACAVRPEDAGSVGPDPQRDIVTALLARSHDEALRLCARHHGETLGRLCMALVGSQSEAEDLVQETLLAAYQGFSGYREQGTVKAWLCSIARRKCARHLEMRSRSNAARATGQQPELVASAEEQIVAHRRAAHARALLESVRPSEREALVLRYAAGLSFHEVALACGIEEPTARKRVSRALAALRARLGAEEQS